MNHTPAAGGTGVVNFVGLGPYRDIVISEDGEQWEVVYRSERCCLQSVAYGNGLWMVVGLGLILTSADGRNWTVSVDEDDDRGDFYSLWTVAYGNGRWVVGGSRAILTSTDGTTWLKVYGEDWDSFGDRPDKDPNLIAFSLSAVAYGDGLWVGGGVNDIFESSDGTNWAALPAKKHHLALVADGGIAFGNGQWYSTGTFGVCTRTPSGEWVRFLSRTDVEVGENIAYGNGNWIAVGWDGMAVWQEAADVWWAVVRRCKTGGGRDFRASSVAHRNGRWVAGVSNTPVYNVGDPKVHDDWMCVPSSRIRHIDGSTGRFSISELAARP